MCTGRPRRWTALEYTRGKPRKLGVPGEHLPKVTALLTEHHVVINAKPPDSGRSTLGTLLLGFLPTLLLIGFFIWLRLGGRRREGEKHAGLRILR